MTSSKDEIIRIHDPQIDVAQLMLQIRENMQSRVAEEKRKAKASAKLLRKYFA